MEHMIDTIFLVSMSVYCVFSWVLLSSGCLRLLDSLERCAISWIVNIRYYDIGGSAETRGKAEIFYSVLSLATAL